MKNFSEIKIGEKCSFEVEITEELHKKFADLSGDKSPVHCDEDFCSKTKFKKKIGYAFLLTSFLSKLYGEYIPGGSSICIKQEAKFPKPFFVGDKIKVIGEVVAKIESTKFVEIKTEMFRICQSPEGAGNANQANEECVFQGIGTVQVIFGE